MNEHDGQDEREGARGPDRRTLLAALLLVLSGTAVYLNSLSNAFVWDDLVSIRDNAAIRSLWPLSESMWGPLGSGSTGRPLVALSLAVNYAIGGLNVLGYHVFNIAVHVLAALALFGLARRWLLRASGATEGVCRATALAIALLWVLHPLNTDALDHVVYRNEAMMGLFYLTTLYCALRGFAARRGTTWFVASIVACLAAASSKEVAVSAPIVVLLLDRSYGAGSFRQALRSHLGLYLGFALSWVLLGVLVQLGERGETVGFEQHAYSSLEYLRTQAGGFWLYLKLCFWPHPLVLDYQDWPLASSVGDWLAPAIGALALLASSILALLKRQAAGILGVAFFLILAPTTSFIPITGEVVAEHRMYLPLCIVIALVVLAVQRVRRVVGVRPPRRAARRETLAACAVVALSGVVLGGMTARRNLDYRSPLRIWTDVVAKRPGNIRGWISVGLIHQQAGRGEEAERAYLRGLALAPRWDRIHFAYANLLFEYGRTEEAVEHYREAVRLEPRLAHAWYNLGRILLRKGETANGLAMLRKALEHQPQLGEAKQKLAWVLATHPDAVHRDGAEAVELAEGLVGSEALAPGLVLDTLAAAYAEAGRFDEARATARRALQAFEAAGRDRRALAVRARLEAYSANRPWRE